MWLLKYLPNMPASHLAIYNDFRGPNNSLTMREAAANARAAASDAASSAASLPIKDGSMLEERPLPRELGSAAVLKGIRDPGVGWNAVGLEKKDGGRR